MTYLRAWSDEDDKYDDPSEDLLFELFMDIERGDADYLIVERVADSSGQTYSQSMKVRDGWTVEHRAGGPDRHFAAMLPTVREAHSLLTRWAFELPGWSDDAVWTRLEMGG